MLLPMWMVVEILERVYSVRMEEEGDRWFARTKACLPPIFPLSHGEELLRGERFSVYQCIQTMSIVLQFDLYCNMISGPATEHIVMSF